jgi:CHAD domain-containing protein
MAVATSERTYRLADAEPMAEGIARMARGRIDDAIDELQGRTDSSREKAVHEARKNMKKLRALVRLARDSLGSKVYARENQTFRDAGQQLSGLRDADVMLATLDDLDSRFPDELGDPATGPSGDLRQALEAHKIRTSAGTAAQASDDVVAVLEKARRRVDGWPLEREGFVAVEGGLERIYRRGRRAFRAARREPTTESLHEWRKRVKDLWYHLDILRSGWTPVMKAMADEAHELSERLGVDHDNAVLLAWAQEHVPDSVDALEGPVARRRAALQADAFAVGTRLYADKPRGFVRRLRRWWNAPAVDGGQPS